MLSHKLSVLCQRDSCVCIEQGVVGSEQTQRKKQKGMLLQVTEDFEFDGLESIHLQLKFSC